MKHINGAQRPTSTCNVLWIAVVAIFLVVATGAAAFSQLVQPYFTLDQSNVMGMMPPTPPASKPGGGGQPKANDFGASQPQAKMAQAGQGNTQAPQNTPCAHGVPLTLIQSSGNTKFTYAASANGCVWLIKRNGSPWLTVAYNATSGAYELTDPNGTGRLLLQLSAKQGPAIQRSTQSSQ
jgi:hypothetical protein